VTGQDGEGQQGPCGPSAQAGEPLPWRADEVVFLRGFGRRVPLWRLYRGLSQEQLGTAAGLSRSLVSSTERGGHSIDLLRVGRLSVAQQVPLSDLVADQAEGLPS
jgi:DNA-binding XRE family transcriptional regulator